MQKQLRRFQEDLMKWKEEMLVENTQDAKRPSPPRVENGYGSPREASSRIKDLEEELKRAEESERNMLESLTSQTKQLETTKMQLEEAKLEIRSLQDTIKSFDNISGTQDEIARIKNELRLAVEAEEKSKKAMDDLAVALREVATEAKEAKEKLKAMETQFLSARAEADHTMSMLKAADQRIQLAVDEVEQKKAAAEEAAATWQTKEDGFVECMKSFEFEINRLKNSNEDLLNSQRKSRDEISKLRDIMKHAVNEATVVKEALEIARNENSQLQDLVAQKDKTFQQLKQDLECLKVSEAAARGSVEELKNLLAVAANIEPISPPTPKELPSFDHQEVEIPRIMERRAFGSFRLPPVDPRSTAELAKHRRIASMSNASTRRASSSFGGSYGDLDGGDGEEMLSAWGSPARPKKKKPMLRKFGEMIKRSFRKQ